MGTVVRLWDIHNGLFLNGLWNISALHDHDGYSPSNQTGGATLESKDL
ncbi:hypothetical protein PSTT_09759 [Puccinia striiformis]|uniref:Uncharacterized protein n=1 Tax=Puccinia striiformis TaxID=27350 RepID=A0A2S4V6X7_9BASI|nr:hypothetical protein PSTT_09759 [Puccinia striiformis]